MTGIVFHDEMVKRMMKSTVNPDAQILETAYETGRKQGEAETVKAVLEIIDEEIYEYEKIMLRVKQNLLRKLQHYEGVRNNESKDDNKM